MSLQIEKQRAKKKQKGKFKIRVRYKHNQYKTIETEDYGSFKEMYSKYKDKYEFWCGDVPPEKNEADNYSGVRLDSDEFDRHTEYSLQRFGKHKCWIDETFKINGKKVCLVYNAQLDSVVGATGTIIGASVALSTVERLQRERARKARKKGQYRTRRDGRKYRKR